MGDHCQVAFYVLADTAPSAERLACYLAMKAWEQGHSVCVRTESQAQAEVLDELMWDYPPGRFLPHASGSAGEDAPVYIQAKDLPVPAGRDLAINLSAEAMPHAERFARLLEIVPAEAAQRTASRLKFKMYRELGLEPVTHDIGKT